MRQRVITEESTREERMREDPMRKDHHASDRQSKTNHRSSINEKTRVVHRSDWVGATDDHIRRSDEFSEKTPDDDVWDEDPPLVISSLMMTRSRTKRLERRCTDCGRAAHYEGTVAELSNARAQAERLRSEITDLTLLNRVYREQLMALDVIPDIHEAAIEENIDLAEDILELCIICLQLLPEQSHARVTLMCGHRFCRLCLGDWANRESRQVLNIGTKRVTRSRVPVSCPTCRQDGYIVAVGSETGPSKRARISAV